ncbi:hypothetical protein [Azorhizobium sp. AG788]|uniref:hypothetical protein n=1 Tax=Azorhizobium sp. AG788 TaxID=2183897 RepID=UPI001FE02FB3|nr:hypothetical protein [Azorhizobium sp. AG788]
MHLGHAAIGHRPDVDAGEGHALVKGGDVRLGAGEPVQILREDEIKRAAPGIRHHALEGMAAVHAGAGHGVIGVNLGDRPALAGGIGAAERHLILNGPLALHLAGKAGIDARAPHAHPPLPACASSRA